jgi:hypothetical protein
MGVVSWNFAFPWLQLPEARHLLALSYLIHSPSTSSEFYLAVLSPDVRNNLERRCVFMHECTRCSTQSETTKSCVKHKHGSTDTDGHIG